MSLWSVIVWPINSNNKLPTGNVKGGWDNDLRVWVFLNTDLHNMGFVMYSFVSVRDKRPFCIAPRNQTVTWVHTHVKDCGANPLDSSQMNITLSIYKFTCHTTCIKTLFKMIRNFFRGTLNGVYRMRCHRSNKKVNICYKLTYRIWSKYRSILTFITDTSLF